ncbi:MAG: peptide chain release factor 2 [Candidatus Omnitrophica bacterium]|nr:peptide chain release factor 2 [Candidatus Omnitrophota bacterium]
MEEIEKEINRLSLEVENIKQLLKIDQKRARIKELQLRMSEANFWQDQKESSCVVEQLKSLKSDVDAWDNLSNSLEESTELLSLSDASLDDDLSKEVCFLSSEVEKLKLRILFSGKFDHSNVIIEINSGAGGTEACDWAGMLFRMYARWAEEKKFKFKVLDEVRGEEAGVKSIVFLIEGDRAYGMLRSERGVHRLVRISPFDANKRRHTSFASVDAIPEVKENIDIDIKAEDLRIDTYRSSGAGGQHVNVTDSAVRITHIPSGIVAACQNERSQHQNKQTAFKVLKAKLYELKEKANKKEMEQMSTGKRKIEWGSQIRSYVLHPYLMVKDHRTNEEVSNAKAVLDGKIDAFIYAYLKNNASEDN